MQCIKCKKDIPQDALFCPYCGKKQQAQRKRRKRANGMGTVYKHPGSRTKPWEAQKAGVHIGYFATKYEAEQALSRFVGRKIEDRLNITFSQAYDLWLPDHSRTITGSGVSGYKQAYLHCSPLYSRMFRSLRTADFQKVIADMEQQDYSKSTCEKVLQLFGQLSKWAIREEIITVNYAQFVTIVAEQKTTKKPFTPAQIAAIQRSPHPAAQVALVLLTTGCRPNELFSVPLSQCHDTYFIGGSKTKAGKNRVIPVSSFGLPAYQAMLSAAKESGGSRLIDGYPGNHSNSNYTKRDWKALMQSLDIQGMTPYNCRHTYATLAVQSGMKPELLQKILGHADYSTTVEVYTHMDISEILQESQKLAVTVTLQSPNSRSQNTP